MSINIFNTCVAMVVASLSLRALKNTYLVQISTITRIKLYPCVEVGSVLRSIAMWSKGSSAVIDFKG